MKRYDFEIKLAILVLTIINMIGKVRKLGRITSRCVSLVTDIKRVEDKYYHVSNKFKLIYLSPV